MQRASVPAALHAELTECTSLVRALRTARTLDLTAHLLQHAARHSGNDADTWTSWPLIDCPVPEWSLQDEIHQLAAHAARALDPDSDAPTSSHLVLCTGAVLVHTLALLADQRPAAPGSMQNRLWPMNWEDVLSLLAVGGVLDPAILARAQKRLERIYGPSSTRAMERLQSARARCASFTSAQEDHLFAPPVLRAHRNARGPRSHKRTVKSSAIVDSDTDADAEHPRC